MGEGETKLASARSGGLNAWRERKDEGRGTKHEGRTSAAESRPRQCMAKVLVVAGVARLRDARRIPDSCEYG